MTEAYDFIQTFDPGRRLQYVNDDPSVMHCHHYATLLTKLAMDFSQLGGTEMLRDSMEEAYYIVLKKALIIREISNKQEMKILMEEHFRLAGLGKLVLSVLGTDGTAKMIHSHMDEGWIKKWGKHETPINFIGQGFLAAAFALLFDKKLRSFTVTEKESIVSGSSYSFFEISAVAGGGYGN